MTHLNDTVLDISRGIVKLKRHLAVRRGSTSGIMAGSRATRSATT